MNKGKKNGGRKEVTPLSEPCCGSCAYFLRHHVLQRENRETRYIPCGCGHCLIRRLRRCLTPNTAPCKKYKRQFQPVRFRVLHREIRKNV